MQTGVTPRQRRTYLGRLRKVVDLLEQLPRKRFDYGRWVGDGWKGDPTLSCGTTACALGWAATIPSLRRAGLVLRRDLRSECGYVTTRRDRRTWSSPGWPGMFEVSLEAACTVFGLDQEEAYDLFVDPGLPRRTLGPRVVARHLRRFIARGGEWG